MKLQEQIGEFKALGAEIWAISPDKAEPLEKMRQEKGLGDIPLLLDPDLAITDSYGLRNESGNLPDPAALIVEPDGKVSYARIDVDFSQRPSNAELLEALGAEVAK